VWHARTRRGPDALLGRPGRGCCSRAAARRGAVLVGAELRRLRGQLAVLLAQESLLREERIVLGVGLRLRRGVLAEPLLREVAAPLGGRGGVLEGRGPGAGGADAVLRGVAGVRERRALLGPSAGRADAGRSGAGGTDRGAGAVVVARLLPTLGVVPLAVDGRLLRTGRASAVGGRVLRTGGAVRRRALGHGGVRRHGCVRRSGLGTVGHRATVLVTVLLDMAALGADGLVVAPGRGGGTPARGGGSGPGPGPGSGRGIGVEAVGLGALLLDGAALLVELGALPVGLGAAALGGDLLLLDLLGLPLRLEAVAVGLELRLAGLQVALLERPLLLGGLLADLRRASAVLLLLRRPTALGGGDPQRDQDDQEDQHHQDDPDDDRHGQVSHGPLLAVDSSARIVPEASCSPARFHQTASRRGRISTDHLEGPLRDRARDRELRAGARGGVPTGSRGGAPVR
jgi:hypothetical protein